MCSVGGVHKHMGPVEEIRTAVGKNQSKYLLMTLTSKPISGVMPSKPMSCTCCRTQTLALRTVVIYACGGAARVCSMADAQAWDCLAGTAERTGRVPNFPDAAQRTCVWTSAAARTDFVARVQCQPRR